MGRVISHNEIITIPIEQPTISLDLFFTNSTHLLPSCVSPRLRADNSASIFLSSAVPQKHEPCGSLVGVAPDKIGAVEGAGMDV
jgi:hypothetical protein